MTLARLHARVVLRTVGHTLREDRWLIVAALVVAVGLWAIASAAGRSNVGLAGITFMGIAQAASFTRGRADREWMRSMGLDRRTLLVVESGLAASPFALLALTTGAPFAPLAALATLLGGVLVGWLPAAGVERSQATARRFVPFARSAPEWTAGVRRSPSVVVLWLLLVAATAWRHWIAPVALVAAGVYCAQFFAIGEPRAWIQSSRALLARKLAIAALIFAMLASTLALAIAFGPARSLAAFGLVALGAFGGWVVTSMAILGKYAYYEEGRDLSRLVALVVALTLLTFLFPLMTLVGWVMLERRARGRLEEVLAC